MTSEPQSPNLPPQETSFDSVSHYSQQVGTLRSRLLTSILPAVLIPLLIASAIGYTITERKAKNRVLERLKNQAILASTRIDSFIRVSFQTFDLITANPEVMQAMKAGSQKAQDLQLNQKSIADLEKQFAATKSLAVSESLDNYLQQIVKTNQFAEIFITDKNGLNIALSNPTSDLVQRDEQWWQTSQQSGIALDEPEFDESANVNVLPFAQALKDPKTEEFLGVIKGAVATTELVTDLQSYFNQERLQQFQLKIFDLDSNFLLYDSQQQQSSLNEVQETEKTDPTIIKDESIKKVVATLSRIEHNSMSLELEEEKEEKKTSLTLEEAQQIIAQQSNISQVEFHQTKIPAGTILVASFKYQNQIYTISTIPQIDLISMGIVDYGIVAAEAKNLLTVFSLTVVFLGTISLALILLLAQQITKPIANLSATTQKVAAGDLDIQADIAGTLETRTLADSFNKLVRQVRESLKTQQILADEQRQAKEDLETAIYTLIDEIAEATEGDLTVRANLNSIELGTVADLFNAIINNLQEIAIEAKQSTRKVGTSLKQNEDAIRLLAQQATVEAEETRNTLLSIEQMSQSIQAVAHNANQAEQIVDNTYNTVLTSTENMDLTVNSIVDLRNTVGETAKKMKRLGESSQKIYQAVSFIEEIALRTNILAINATVEAGRAGEYGEGFTIVAEQVATLAEQSATATKEIADIVAAIQAETQEVNQAMESGTTQVVETTRLIESTKESLNVVLEKSQEINQLMKSISENTLSQADTSQNVTNLMQKIAQLSETTSKSSQEVAQSIMETAQVAAKLESTVSQFKVAESA